MQYAVHSDRGNVKKVNQDSAMVRKAMAGKSEVLFAVICDGMGGLSNGEVASADVVGAMEEWFSTDLPYIAEKGLNAERLKRSMNDRIIAEDELIAEYSRRLGDCGTTLTGVFLCAGRFLCVNVGDSRVYRIREQNTELLTHDQTVVQQMLDGGEISQDEAVILSYEKKEVQDMIDGKKLTPAQIRAYRMKNVLLQCIGVEGDVVPDYTEGTYEKGDVFVLCSDGFRHKLSEEEIAGYFSDADMKNEKKMKRAAVQAVEENMRRGERDNITVIVIKV